MSKTKKLIPMLGALITIVGGFVFAYTHNPASRVISGAITIVGVVTILVSIPWRNIGLMLLDINREMAISMVDSTWLFGINEDHKKWVLWSLEKALKEWIAPLEDYNKVYLSVIKSLQYAFLEGPDNITASPVLWSMCMKDLGIAPGSLRGYFTDADTQEKEFLELIIYVS